MIEKMELVCDGFRLWTHHTFAEAAREDEHARENLDVFVEAPGGKRYGGTFITSRCVQAIMARSATTGEAAGGEFFYCVGMVIIRRMTRECIEATFRELVRSGEYEHALFRRDDADHVD